MRRAMIAGGVAATAVLAYTVPFALAAREGYAQDRLKVQLQGIYRDDESLRIELASLKNPTRVEAYAVQSGMVLRRSARFVTIPRDDPAKPASPTLLARLVSFRLP